MSRTPSQVIQEHYAASARNDLDGMVADFAPDLSWTEMAGFPYAGTYRGPDGVRSGVFERLGADWTDFRAEPDQLVVDGDQVVAFGRYSGVFGATGQPVSARFTHHWTLREEQIVGFEQFTDTVLFARAMGRD